MRSLIRTIHDDQDDSASRSSSGAPNGSRFAGALLSAALLIACSSDKGAAPIGAAGSVAPVPGAGTGTPLPTAGVVAPGQVTPVTAGTGTPTTPVGTPQVGAAGTGAPVTPTPGEVPTPGTGETPEQIPTTTAVAPYDWTMMGFDQHSTYNNVAETKISKTTVPNLKEVWTADMGGQVLGAALIIGDRLYATAPNSIRAFELATGTELWRFMADTTSALSYYQGTLYAHTLKTTLVALNAADGKEIYTKKLNEQTGDGSSSPMIVGDVIILGGANGNTEVAGGAFRGHLLAVDRVTGDNLWTTYTVPENGNGASIWSTPTVDVEAGVVYAGTGNNYGSPASDTSDSIIQFDLKTGAIKWKAQRVENDTFGGGSFIGPDYDFGANPVLYETMVDGVMTKMVAAGAKSGSAHGIRRDTGEVVWTRALGDGFADGSRGIFTNGAWTGKNMIMACNEGGPATLYALDGATGNIVWMRALDRQVWGRITIANGVGFAGVGETFEAFDIEDGKVLFSFPAKTGTIASTPTVSNGWVAFGEGLTWASQMAGTTLHVLSIQ